jgi:coenzyme Q-binding protein COQ10
MPRHDFSRSVDFSAQQMFDLVADVENYDQFLPLCTKSEVSDVVVDENGVRRFTAALLIERASLRISETFVSQVVTDPNKMTVLARSQGGPIKTLDNAWRFVDRPNGGSQTRMILDFEMANLPLRLLMKASFDLAMRKLTDAFENRAHKLYKSHDSF